jgi:saccharopine dehydrogenase-like NADP-dependent oxidoreductase
MKRVVVLGAGLVGKVMALDLSKDFSVTSVDLNEEALQSLSAQGIETRKLNFTDTDGLKSLMQPFDLVIGAVPGFLGFNVVKAVIEAGKNIVDISFFPEDPFELHSLALAKQVIAITDCGVAPGMGNILLGYHNKQMEVTSYECLVGGLPVVREWPYEYKAVFSPIDVIEEYTRPARYVVNGQVVIKEALSDAELIHFKEAGTLESWNSDGLRSLIKTMAHIPNMIEKTLRYPGCVEYLKVLRETGFFSYEPIIIDGHPVRPIDVTSRLLFPKWKLKPGEEEFTIMRVRMEGKQQGVACKIQYDLFDRTDRNTGTLSMARTTGYTCTAAAHLVLNGQYQRAGISPPEYLGEDPDHFGFIKEHLKSRGVHYLESTF